MKTAVEWLYDELSKNNTSIDSVIERIDKESSIWEQAKEKEKEQIVNAYKSGVKLIAGDIEDASNYYYNQTYNQNK